MKKLFKWIAVLLGAVVLEVVAAIIIVPMVFDPNDHKEKIATTVEEKTGRQLNIDGDIKVSFLAGYILHLRHGEKLNFGILSYTAKINFQAAVRRAHLRKVLVGAGHAAAQVSVLFDQHHLTAGFGRFDGRGDATDPAADYEHLSRFAVSAHFDSLCGSPPRSTVRQSFVFLRGFVSRQAASVRARRKRSRLRLAVKRWI